MKEPFVFIIDDILRISIIESDTVKIYLANFSINDQMEYFCRVFKQDAKAKGITLSFQPLLPEKNALIRTDKDKFISVMSNLIKNAIRYTEAGSVIFGYVKKEREFEFYVRDTGIGISRERQDAVFECFIQADIENKMAKQGAGLGLSITKAYVEMLGGIIWVESEPNKGSCFYFILPDSYNADR